MATERYRAETLRSLLKKRKIATMAELKAALGTDVDMTVTRKLKALSYRTSYSHRGGYYTLDEIARFDELGLWSFRSVWFSECGTLVATAEACVEASEGGYYASELESVLHVGVKDALRKLVRDERIAREKLDGRYLYCSASPSRRKQQLTARQVHEAKPSSLGLGVGVRVLPEELKAAIVLFHSLLDEKQRRLYAGLEAMKIGHGGDRQIAELLGLHPDTVAKGRRELLDRDVEIEKTRRKGGGRKPLEKKRRRSSRKSKRS